VLKEVTIEHNEKSVVHFTGVVFKEAFSSLSKPETINCKVL